MNSNPQSIPNLLSLYHRDLIMNLAARTIGFSLFAAAGVWWATQPVPSVVKVENSPLELWVAEWGPLVAIGVAALALVVLVRRYLWVKQVLSHGITLKGTVEEVDVYARESSSSDTTPAFRRPVTRTYYAIIRYTWQGVDKKVRIKLPNAPSVYQAFKGHEIDLILLDSAPDKPLIRVVYLGRF